MKYNMKGSSFYGKNCKCNSDSPLKVGKEIRKDSTSYAYNKDTTVNSTPVGHDMNVPARGYGFSAAIKNPGKGDMWKSARDQKATEKLQQENKTKSSKSKPGIGGQRMIMPE